MTATSAPTAFGAGIAQGPDLEAAAVRAAADARATLAGARPDLAAVFVCSESPELAARALSAASRELGAAHVIGCTTGGVIGRGTGLEASSSVSVWAACLPESSVRAFHLEVLRTDAEVAVLGMPERRLDEGVAVLLADPWSFPADGFLSRSDQLMPGLGVCGGLASGVGGPGATRLLIDGRVVDRGAVGVLLGGGIDARIVVSQGCRPVGPAMAVTRVEGGDVFELAGQPALDRLEQVLAGLEPHDQALATAGLQIGIALDEYADSHGHGDFLVRAVLGGSRETGAVSVGEGLAVGQTVRFHVRDAAAADDDLRTLLARSAGDVTGALLFSCNGRGTAMFTSADHDAAVVSELIGSEAVAGFFAGGELGPVGGRNRLHTLTASMLLFG